MKTTATRASAVSQTRGLGDLLYDKAGSRPSLDLDFAGTSSLRDKITGEDLVDHTRGSKGTYIGSDGLVKEAVTNYVLYSQDLGNSWWDISGGTVTSNFAEAPDGTQTATKVTINTGGSTYFGRANNLNTLTPGKTYTWSIWVKSTGVSSHFTMQANVLGASSSEIYQLAKTPTPTEWTRYSVTFVATSATQQAIYFNNQPDDYSVEALIWGAQVNEGSEPLDYVKTTSTINSAPRFTHERVETGNLLRSTEQLWDNSFSGSGISHVGGIVVKRSNHIAPDGTMTAFEITGIDSAGDRLDMYTTVPATNSTFTFSAYYRGSGDVRIAMNTSTGVGNLTEKTITLTNEWVRHSATVTFNNPTGNLRCHVAIARGTTTMPTEIHVAHPQIEESDSETTYVPSIDTFTSRASSATYVDSAGLIKKAALNEIFNSAAPNHHSHTTSLTGVSISVPTTAPTRTNPFGNQTKVKTVVATSSKPDFTVSSGTLGVDAISNQKIRIGAGGGGYGIGGTGSTNVVYTWSLYFRSNSGDTLLGFEYGNEIKTTKNLTATSEWQRVELTGKHQNYNYLFFDIYYLFNGAADLEFTAFQVEKGTTASDYVETEYKGNSPGNVFNTSAEARYSHDPETLTPTGLYLEPEQAIVGGPHNLVGSNGNLSGWTLWNATHTANAEIAPDGTQTATKVVPSSASQNGERGGLSGTNSIVFSGFFKSAGYRYIHLGLHGSPESKGASFDIINGTVARIYHSEHEAAIEKYPNGWFRCILRRPTGNKNGYAQWHIQKDPYGNNQWNGTSNELDDFVSGVYVWGLNIGYARYESSFIYNTGTGTVTRAADVYTSTANLTETFEPRGLLIEESRTNVVQYSEDFTDRGSTSGWADHNNRVTITANATTAPDGTQTADKIIPTTANESGHLCHHLTNSDGIASVYAKAAGYNYVSVILQKTATNGAGVSVNLTNGTIHASHNIHADTKVENVGNGWYRIVLKSSTTGHNHFSIQPHNGGTPDNNYHFRTTFAGDGTSGVFLWGAQQEVGTFATSYIPTSGSHATRSADVVSISGDNFGTYRTNLVTNTSFRKGSDGYLITGVNANATYESYAGISPSGNYDALKMTATSTTGTHRILQYVTLDNSSVYSVSAYVKAGSSDKCIVNLWDGDSNVGMIRVDLTAETAESIGGIGATNVDITDVGNDWYLIEFTSITTTVSGSPAVIVSVLTLQNAQTYAGNGESIFVWGMQAVKSDTPSEFIPSTDTFTSRLGNATYVDSNGLIKTAYRNNIKHSQNINDSLNAWSRREGSQTQNAIVAPDGTQTATLYVPNTNSVNNHYMFQEMNPFVNGALSLHVKSAGMSHLSLIAQHPSDSSAAAGVSFNINNGTIHASHNASGEIKDVGNGWFRVIVKPTVSHNFKYLLVQPHNGLTPSTTNRFRVSYSGNNTDGVYIWGAMWTDDRNNGGDYVKTEGTRTGGPRYSHDPETLVPTGLYLEPAATNYIKYSEELTNSNGWNISGSGNSTLTRTQDLNIVNPTGGTGASKIEISRTVLSSWRAVRANSLNIGSSGINTVSAWLKAATSSDVGKIVSVWQYDGGFRVQEHITLTDKWVRFSFTSITTDGSLGEPLNFGVLQSSVGVGGVVNTETSVNFYVWGAQLETGSYSSSYIPTTSSTVTRAADTYTSTATTVLDRDGGNKEAFWSPTANAVYTEAIYNPNTTYPRVINYNGSNGTSEVGSLFFNHINNQLNYRHFATSSSTAVVNFGLGGSNLNAVNKSASTFQLNDAQLSNNGFIHTGDTDVALHVLPADTKLPYELEIGNWGGNTDRCINAPIQRITHWKTRLPDSSLINITNT